MDNICRVLHWNTQGISTAKQDEPTMLAFQETFLANDCQIKLKGYHGVTKQGTFNRRYHGGVVIYIHESCPFQENYDTELQLRLPLCISPAARRYAGENWLKL